MFGLFESGIDNALNVVSKVLDGEDISRQEVSKLASDIVDVIVLDQVADISLDLINKIIENGSD
jgi:hypothetical protein